MKKLLKFNHSGNALLTGLFLTAAGVLVGLAAMSMIVSQRKHLASKSQTSHPETVLKFVESIAENEFKKQFCLMKEKNKDLKLRDFFNLPEIKDKLEENKFLSLSIPKKEELKLDFQDGAITPIDDPRAKAYLVQNGVEDILKFQIFSKICRYKQTNCPQEKVLDANPFEAFAVDQNKIVTCGSEKSPSDPTVGGVAEMSVGQPSCGIFSGKIKCWGNVHSSSVNAYFSSQQASGGALRKASLIHTPELGKFEKITTSAGSGAAIHEDGTVWRLGSIGLTPSTSSVEGRVKIFSGAQDIFLFAPPSSPSLLCVIRNGALECAGTTADVFLKGACSDSNINYLPQGTRCILSGLGSGVSQATLGHRYLCALQSGAVKCVFFPGINSGIFDIGFSNLSVEVFDFKEGGEGGVAIPMRLLEQGVTKISGGLYHFCAVVNGAAKCWGFNHQGQLGNGTILNSTEIINGQLVRHAQGVTQVSGLADGVTDISAGHSNTCAVQNGAVKCWGSKRYGVTGQSFSDGSPQTTPVQVKGLEFGVKRVQVGGEGEFACALLESGVVKCWGYNGGYTNLGIGIPSSSNDGSTLEPLNVLENPNSN